MTELPLHAIDSFSGDYLFLSNFWPCEKGVPYKGLSFPTSEHAFAAAKTSNWDAILEIQAAPSPKAAKAIGRRVSLISGWDRVKYAEMASIVAAKFSADSTLQDALVDTMGYLLIEGNSWHDQIWGSCACQSHIDTPGQNALGTVLMQVRQEAYVRRMA